MSRTFPYTFEPKIYDRALPPSGRIMYVTGKVTLEDPFNPGSFVIGYPSFAMEWQDDDQTGNVPTIYIDSLHQAMVNWLASQPNITDVTGGTVTVTTQPLSPSP